jgi:hypothetical protein
MSMGEPKTRASVACYRKRWCPPRGWHDLRARIGIMLLPPTSSDTPRRRWFTYCRRSRNLRYPLTAPDLRKMLRIDAVNHVLDNIPALRNGANRIGPVLAVCDLTAPRLRRRRTAGGAADEANGQTLRDQDACFNCQGHCCARLRCPWYFFR